ncbi:MAG: hypothetical protein Q9163_001404 [Psora crenata]
MLQNHCHHPRDNHDHSPSKLSDLVFQFPPNRHQPAPDSSVPKPLPSSHQILSRATKHISSISVGKDIIRHGEPLRTAPLPSVSVLCKPKELTLRHSNFSSFESLTRDQSGLSTQSSHPTTPSPVKPFAEISVQGDNSLSETDMGQKPSVIKRKPVQLHDKPSLDAFSTSPPRSPDTSPEKTAAETDASLALRQRVSSVQVPIPRRRSSLTALHLDSSHFDTPISHGDELKHRASTLTSSSLRQRTKSPGPITPSVVTHGQRGDTLSPPILSTLPMDRPSTASELECTPSPSPSSVAPPQIHLPVTFPNGPIPTPKPPLTRIHYECYVLHRRMPRSSNKLYPVPCMACGTVEGDSYWKCVWCCLRVCGECMAEFSGRERKLDVLLDWLDKKGQDTEREAKKTVEKQSVGKEKKKEKLEVKEVGVFVTDSFGKRAAANILREARG